MKNLHLLRTLACRTWLRFAGLLIGGASLVHVGPSVAAATVAYPLGLHDNGGSNAFGAALSSAIRTADGSTYGVMNSAGPYFFTGGVLFKLSDSGAYTQLHAFSGQNGDGYNPVGMVLGSDGKFYGAAANGGSSTADCGTIWRYDPAANQYSTLYEFTGASNNNSCTPLAPPIEATDNDGSKVLFGTTAMGGTNNTGTVYKVTKNGTFTRLRSFAAPGSAASGIYPDKAGLTLGSDGRLYGTTREGGGSMGFGVVYGLGKDGSAYQYVAFPNTGDLGCHPVSGVIMGSSALFGATLDCDSDGFGLSSGTIYTIALSGGSLGAITRVYTTDYNIVESCGPHTRPVISGGYLYGTTVSCIPSASNIYRLSLNAPVTFNVIYRFDSVPDGPNGAEANLNLGSDGKLYGSTSAGNIPGSQEGLHGAHFRINTDGTGITHILDAGAPPREGYQPEAPLMIASDGHFYTTTTPHSVAGSLIRLTTAGVLSTPHEFGLNGDCYQGCNPSGPLTQGVDGALYGTVETDSAGDAAGLIYRYDPASGEYSVFYDLQPSLGEGQYPVAGVQLAADGNFYGSTRNGGPADAGTLFRLTPQGVLTTLKTLDGNTIGGWPDAAMTAGPDGKLYGTLHSGSGGSGTVFRLTPSTGAFQVIGEFEQETTGNNGVDWAKQRPAPLVPGKDGLLYGVNAGGGPNGDYGVVYSVDTANNTIKPVYTFTQETGEEHYKNGLMAGRDGNFYGTQYGTPYGGTASHGQIYRVTPQGEFSVIATLSGFPSGDEFHSTLVTGADGRLYATTAFGGPYAYGNCTDGQCSGYGTIMSFDGPAAVPTDLSAVVTGKSATLSWTAAAGASSYSVYQRTRRGGASLVASGLTAPTYTVSELARGTAYYTVRAVNSVGETQPSNEVAVKASR